MSILTADGCVDEIGAVTLSGCCPPPLGQIDDCAMACSFVNLLPSGPMWDRAKAEMLDYYRGNNGMAPCDGACPPPELACQSIVAYAVYLSKHLLGLLNSALMPALRESSPHTATSTLDDWLDRLGWQDCYATQCRSVLLGDLTPFEIMGECGPVFCPVGTPAALECAVKQGIAAALRRAQMGGIKNLCWLNWVIEPLGAKIAGRNVPECTPDFPGKCKCVGMQFEISPISNFLPACRQSGTEPGDVIATDTVDARIMLNTCTTPAGMPSIIWPGIIAAECIVRSLLPPKCPNNIFRSC